MAPAALLGVSSAHGQTTAPWPDLHLAPLITDGLRSPLFVTQAGDGSDRLFVVEKAGLIRIVRNGAVVSTPFLDIRDRVGDWSECGLLSVAFPTDFADAGYFFVYYSYDTRTLGDLVPSNSPDVPSDEDGCDTVVARFRVSDDVDVADPASEERLLTINQPYGNHNGGQLVFGLDGALYIGLGDGGSGGDPHNLAQNPDSLLGKLLRINVGPSGPYTIPPDNPLVDDPRYRAEIWALGLRNPWRFSFDRQSGDLYLGDVGQGDFEEINVQPSTSRGGENYGWKVFEGFHCYVPPNDCDDDGMTPPVVEYDHAQGNSVTGGYVYRGVRYPRLDGVYLYGDFGNGRIWGLRKRDGAWEHQLLLETGWRGALASFGEDEDGELYLVDFRGALFRIGDTIELSDLDDRTYLPTIHQ